MKRIFILGCILTLFVASASAQLRSDRVRRERVERGFDKGQLTRPERFKLRKDAVRYKAEKRRALRDGKITRSERRKLAKMKRNDSRKIYRMRHNRRTRVI